MVMFYAACFDVADTLANYGTITFSTSGKSNAVVTISALGNGNTYGDLQNWLNPVLTGGWLSVDWRDTNLLRAQAGVSFPAQVQSALRAAATVSSWTSPSNITVTFNATTNPPRYEFAYPTGFTAITFSQTSGRNLLGFSGNFSGSSALVTGTLTPSTVIVPSQPGASMVTPDYEPKPLGGVGCAGNGTVFGVHRYTSEILRDWFQQYETKAKTYREFAGGGALSFQGLYEAARHAYPFAVCNGFGQSYHEAFFLRDARFSPKRASPGNDAQFHIPFHAVVAGRSS